MTSSFISSNSSGKLFIKTNSLWVIFYSIKAFETKTSTLFNLNFAADILSCFFFFFLIADLYFLIPAVIIQIFNPIAELVIPIRILTRETKADMGTHPITEEINPNLGGLFRGSFWGRERE